MTTATTLNVGAWLAQREQVDARLMRRLAEHGRWDLIDVIFGDRVPALLRGARPTQGGER